MFLFWRVSCAKTTDKAGIEDPEIIERILGHLGRAEAPADPAHPGQAKRRRRESRARPKVDWLI